MPHTVCLNCFYEVFRLSAAEGKTDSVLYDLCAQCGFLPNLTAEGYNDYGVIGMVSLGEGIALVPSSGFLNVTGVVPVELDLDKPLTRDINVVWRGDKSLPNMTQRFLNMLIEDSKNGTLITC